MQLSGVHPQASPEGRWPLLRPTSGELSAARGRSIKNKKNKNMMMMMMMVMMMVMVMVVMMMVMMMMMMMMMMIVVVVVAVAHCCQHYDSVSTMSTSCFRYPYHCCHDDSLCN